MIAVSCRTQSLDTVSSGETQSRCESMFGGWRDLCQATLEALLARAAVAGTARVSGMKTGSHLEAGLLKMGTFMLTS